MESFIELTVDDTVVEGALPKGMDSIDVVISVALMDAATADYLAQTTEEVRSKAFEVSQKLDDVAELHEEVESHAAAVNTRYLLVSELVPEAGDISEILRFKGPWLPSSGTYPDITNVEVNAVFEAADAGEVGGEPFSAGDLLRRTSDGWVRHGGSIVDAGGTETLPFTQEDMVSNDAPHGSSSPGTPNGSYRLARSIHQKQVTEAGYNSLLHVTTEGTLSLTGAVGNLRIPVCIPDGCYNWGMLTCYLKISKEGFPDEVYNHAMRYEADPSKQYVEILDESGDVVAVGAEEITIDYMISGSLPYIYAGAPF